MRAKAVSKVINMDKKNGRKLSNVLKDVQDEKGTETGEEKIDRDRTATELLYKM